MRLIVFGLIRLNLECMYKLIYVHKEDFTSIIFFGNYINFTCTIKLYVFIFCDFVYV